MAQSYANHGGSGYRSQVVCISNCFNALGGPDFHATDGDNSTNGIFYFGGGTNVGTDHVRFDFKEARVIDEAKFYQENTTSHGVWKWQGSNDASSWTDIGSSFTLGGSATQTITTLNGNTTAWRYYQIVGVSGSRSTGPWVYEFEFRIDVEATVSTAYANTLGEGNRSGSITVTTTHSLGAGSIGTLVNGNLIEQTLFFTNGAAVSGNYIKFDFGTSKVITEATWFQSTFSTHGTWKWQGSPDNTTWTDIGSSFTLGGDPQHVQTQLSGNGTAYRYYRLLGVSGSTSSSPWLHEVAFKIGDAGHSIVTQTNVEVIAETSSDNRVTQVNVDVIGEGGKARVTQTTSDVIADGGAKARVTQDTIDVIADGEFNERVTQLAVDIIADVVGHVVNVRVTQTSIEVIGEPPVVILTPSPLPDSFQGDAYSTFISATGLGALTYSITYPPTYATTSVTSMAISSIGTLLTFTIGTGKPYVPGDKIIITFDGSNYMHATVVSYNSGTGVMTATVTSFAGSGTHASWTVNLRTTPEGFSINPTTGEITGPFTEAGTFTFVVTVVDSLGHTASATYSITVTPAITQSDVELNLGIGVFGMGYTISRGLSGIECHFDMNDVGLGSGDADTYHRSKTFFPRNNFPPDQKFYLEIVGSNIGASPASWLVKTADIFVAPEGQYITMPAGYSGRFRNPFTFDCSGGVYEVKPPPFVASLNDAQAAMIRIVAPLLHGQQYVSEVRLTQSSVGSAADQTIGGPDLFRTSNYGPETAMDGPGFSLAYGAAIGWTRTNQPVFKWEAAAWERVAYVYWLVVMANASFTDQIRFKYSEVALVDIDDTAEFGFSRKMSTKNIDIFLTPDIFALGINPTHMRDGHRYQVFMRSVKPDGYFTFNTYLHTSRIQLGVYPGNKAEIYNRVGALKRCYMPGFMTPQPEIFFQVASDTVSTGLKLRNMGPSTPGGNTSGSGTDIAASNIDTIANDVARTAELSAYLTAGHDYESGVAQGELVYRFTDVIRPRSHNYMF